ncbi:MAG: protein-methionine-sulfoxide reductase catalytic subunit MsrP [Bryobacterales bacterium]|nr:protein-methionine-sulfoxide reductase catalytic subunit MsrP [Bryobacterales bacterium]MDE0621648.1 protein-methionine-sulfoxide reductase catalytic subunit MsrP [Bryobacterales bacterium]
MLIKTPRGWEIPESQATSEDLFHSRRAILEGMGLAGAAGLLPSALRGAEGDESLYPAKRNTKYTLDRPLTAEAIATGYNNFYEFTLDKGQVRHQVDQFKIDPWKVKVSGLVNNPKTYDIDDLVRRFPLEERLYRFRCVEAWSMAVPWTGFPMAALLKEVDPKPEAGFVKMVTAYKPREMPGIASQPHYDWPYQEALTLDEAMNELALFCTGLYGKPLPKQNGAPIRAIMPWKYGLKNIKSIVEIEVTKKRPPTLWNKAAPTEYGWYSNVNPMKPHPRWSQAQEKLLALGPGGSFMYSMRPTLMYNGYEAFVSEIYTGDEY